MIQETPNYSGGCLSRQRRRSKTAPVKLIDVIPAAATLTHTPQESHQNGPSLQGIAPHPLSPTKSSPTLFHTNKQKDHFGGNIQKNLTN